MKMLLCHPCLFLMSSVCAVRSAPQNEHMPAENEQLHSRVHYVWVKSETAEPVGNQSSLIESALHLLLLETISCTNMFTKKHFFICSFGVN